MTDLPEVTDVLVLRTGERVTIRPIRASDAPGLAAMHARLTADSIYRRYFAARPELSPTDARWLTTLDEPWRFALVATDADGDLVGVVRYEGEENERSADLALIVDDAVQRSGLGRGLLERLVDVAFLQGLESVKADVLGANTGMLKLLRALGLPMSAERDGPVVTLLLDLRGMVIPHARLEIATAHSAQAAAARRPNASA